MVSSRRVRAMTSVASGMRFMLCCLVACACLVGPVQAMVEALVSQTDIIEGRPFQLILRVDSAAGGQPDLEPLGADFRVARRSTSTNLSIVGGRTSRSTAVSLELIPLRAGTLTIPAISFPNGEQSDALTIEVKPPQPVVDDGLPDLIVELEADTESAYVQQQIRVTMRLLRRVEIGQNAVLNEPVTSRSVMMKRLGEDDRRYRERRSGERYMVHEREYAVFPQESGTLEIGPAVFEGEVITGARTMGNPFAQMVQFEAVPSNVLKIEVKPIPASFSGAVWLPAKRLDLHEEYAPKEAALHVGDPLVRTLYMWAEGLTSGQLPEFSLAPGDGVTVYPEPAQTNDQESKEGFASVRQQDFTLIANRPGDWSLPEIVVPWWNVETDTQEYARLPARSFSALPARGVQGPDAVTQADPAASATGASNAASGSGAAAAGASSAIDGAGLEASGDSAAPGSDGSPRAPLWLVILASVSTLGWLVTAIVLIARQRAGGNAHAATEPPGANAAPARPARVTDARRALDAALATGDAHAIKTGLLNYGAALAPTAPPRSLSALSAWLPPAQSSALASLESALYRFGASGQVSLPADIAESLATGAARAGTARKAFIADGPLPPMYPIIGRHVDQP